MGRQTHACMQPKCVRFVELIYEIYGYHAVAAQCIMEWTKRCNKIGSSVQTYKRNKQLPLQMMDRA